MKDKLKCFELILKNQPEDFIGLNIPQIAFFPSRIMPNNGREKYWKICAFQFSESHKKRKNACKYCINIKTPDRLSPTQSKPAHTLGKWHRSRPESFHILTDYRELEKLVFQTWDFSRTGQFIRESAICLGLRAGVCVRDRIGFFGFIEPCSTLLDNSSIHSSFLGLVIMSQPIWYWYWKLTLSDYKVWSFGSDSLIKFRLRNCLERHRWIEMESD